MVKNLGESPEHSIRGQRVEVVDIPEAVERMFDAIRDGALNTTLREPPTPDVIRRVYGDQAAHYNYVECFKYGVGYLAKDLANILMLAVTRQDSPSPEELREWLRGNAGMAQQNKKNAAIEFANAIAIGALLDTYYDASWRTQEDTPIWRLRDEAHIGAQEKDILTGRDSRYVTPAMREEAASAMDQFCEVLVGKMMNSLAALNVPAMQAIGIRLNTESLTRLAQKDRPTAYLT